MSFLSNYGLFLLKTLTILFAILAIILPLLLFSQKEKQEKGKLEITHLNEKYQAILNKLKQTILSKEEYKKFLKSRKQNKEKNKNEVEKDTVKKKIFILKFQGDIKANDTEALTESINAVLSIATPKDEVVVRLESSGGMVYAYGLASSQLHRIREAEIPLTIAIDKVAASGGYMMACVANKILAAPFAAIGSIGVLAQIPNFHRLLEKNYIDFEQIMGGKYKRTLTMFGENTLEARKKFQEEIDQIHQLFKDFIHKNRPQVDIEKVATGEYWQAEKAIEFNLVDQLITSDSYILSQLDQADLYEIHYVMKKSLTEKLGLSIHILMEKLFTALQQKQSEKNLV